MATASTKGDDGRPEERNTDDASNPTHIKKQDCFKDSATRQRALIEGSPEENRSGRHLTKELKQDSQHRIGSDPGLPDSQAARRSDIKQQRARLAWGRGSRLRER